MTTPQELERGLRGILNTFFYQTSERTNVDRLAYDLEYPPSGRHNYQRDWAKAHPTLRVYYRDMCIARISLKPAVADIVRRKPEEAPKGYFASKVLEKVLFYNFPHVRVK